MSSAHEIPLKERRRGLEYAARVSALAAEAPDEESKRVVYSACRVVEKLYGFSRAEKKAVILRLVHLGAASIAELVQESGFHRDDVQLLTKELVADGRVREEYLRMTGGHGRPSARFFPTGDPVIY